LQWDISVGEAYLRPRLILNSVVFE